MHNKMHKRLANYKEAECATEMVKNLVFSRDLRYNSGKVGVCFAAARSKKFPDDCAQIGVGQPANRGYTPLTEPTFVVRHQVHAHLSHIYISTLRTDPDVITITHCREDTDNEKRYKSGRR